MRSVRPDVQVDRLVAHDRNSLQPEPPHHLLRAQIFPQQSFDDREVLRSIATIAPRSATTTAGLLDREPRPIRSVLLGAVAPDLAINRGAMPLQLTRDLRHREL